MADDPQEELIPVRYTGAHGLIVNGQGIGPGDTVYLPPEEVAQWPDPHPYYERADEAGGGRREAPEDADAAASAAPAPRKARAPAAGASEEAAAVAAAEPAAAQQG